MLETLRRIVVEVSSAENLDKVLSVIVKRVKQFMATDVCSVYLFDTDSAHNVLMATDGLKPSAVRKVRMAQTEGLIGLVTERAEPVNLENAPDHPRYKYMKQTGEEQFHGFLGVPIVQHGKVMGVLVVQQKEHRSFDENEVTLLVTMAGQLAGVIGHAQAIGDIQGLSKSRVRADKPFKGLPGAPGVGCGTGVVVFPPSDLNAVPDRFCEDPEGEVQVFINAVNTTKADIQQLQKRMANMPSESQALFDAYLLMLGSDSLIKTTITRIRENKILASTALRDTIQQQAQVFAAMEDEYLSSRAEDVRDLGTRILVHIQSKAPLGPRVYPEKTILIGQELTASALIEVPPEHLAGVVSTQGSGSSHVAILARALGIPAVMGATDIPCKRFEAMNIVVDGYQGLIYADPSQTVIKEYDRLIKEEQALSSGLEELKNKPAETPDGVRIPLFINSGLLSDVSSAQSLDAEGIGLYRTEFPFMIRDRFPGEEEQTAIYQQVLKAFHPRPVTLRTLDIGGDKALSYFPIKEDNPFLGWRGIRISLDRPDIFITQLRAMLRASSSLDNLHILLPMISSVDEVDKSLEYIKRARKELIESGLNDISIPKVGAMIEVPSAVYQADLIAKRVDFLSIGTNDLVQYLLAVDRNNSNVAGLFDSLHPAVIRAVNHVAQCGAAQKIPVSVCGEMAGDPAAVILLLGMGLDYLSMSIVALPRIKWVIRSFTFQHAKQILDKALSMESAEAIREMLHLELERAGLGGLVRPGKS